MSQHKLQDCDSFFRVACFFRSHLLFFQVTSIEGLRQNCGMQSFKNSQNFLQALHNLETTPSYCSESAILEIDVLWNFVEEVSPTSSKHNILLIFTFSVRNMFQSAILPRAFLTISSI